QAQFPGRLIFEIEGTPQKKGVFKKTNSHLAFYTEGIIIKELGDVVEIRRRNIANVYYSAPMVGEQECVTVEIDHHDEGGIDTYPLDEDTWPGIFAQVDRLLNHEWYEFRKTKVELPDEVKWFNAVNAVIALASEGDAELFGGDVKTPAVAVGRRETLYEYWKINVRQDLLDWVVKLEGGRSAKQASEIAQNLIRDGINPDSLSDNAKRELGWSSSNEAIAWDLGRMMWIAAQGYLADYLSYEEAIDCCTKAGKRLQELFGSWDEMFANYMQGYVYWSGDNPNDEDSESHQRLDIYQWLKAQARSPYQIDWRLDLGGVKVESQATRGV
ncbi:MAG: DUF1266 domain-containing protein, partial [Coriobacteriales bacterium]|nr:DUF1266 domain-containing protein [Coriobacteriales bacterium]